MLRVRAGPSSGHLLTGPELLLIETVTNGMPLLSDQVPCASGELRFLPRVTFKWRSFCVALIFGSMGGTISALLWTLPTSPPPNLQRVPIGGEIFGVTSVLLMFFTAGKAMCPLLPGSTSLTLSRDGFAVQRCFRTRHYAWGSTVGFHPQDKVAGVRHTIPACVAVTARVAGSAGVVCWVCIVDIYTMPREELAPTMTKWANRYRPVDAAPLPAD